MYRYYELIDDMGQDYYRRDVRDDSVQTWDPWDARWFWGDIDHFTMLEWIESSTYTQSFTEVTEDDVR